MYQLLLGDDSTDSTKIRLLYEKDVCLFIGTGDNRQLKHIKVPLVPISSCNDSWFGNIQETNICAGNGETGACKVIIIYIMSENLIISLINGGL